METVGLLMVFVDALLGYIREGLWLEMYSFTFGGNMGNLLLGRGMAPADLHVPTLICYAVLALAPLIMLGAGGLMYGLVWRKARRYRALHSALYNEMYRQHKYRCQRLALWMTVGLGLLSMCIIPPRYPHVIVTEMVILAGLLSLKISWLIFNRR